MDVVEYRGDQYQVSRTFLRQIGGRAALGYLLQGVDWANRYSGVIKKVGSTATKVYKAIADKVGEFQVDRQIANEEYRLAKRQKLDEVARNLERDFEVERSGPAFTFASSMGDQVQFRRMKFTVGRTHRRSANEVFKKQVGSMDEHICRWSRVSPNLLGPGRLTLTYGKDSTAPVDNKPSVRMPLHIMSLTHFPNGNHNTAVGAKPQGMAAIVYRGDGGTTTVAAGSFGHQLIQNESPAGAVKDDGSWEFELGGDFPVNFENVFHKWTEVRLNLYGATLVPLTYTVTVLTGMPEEMQLFEYEPVSASGSASANLTSFPIVRQSPLNEFFRERLHRYLGNPIVGNSDTKTVSGKYRILFEKKITVAPLSYGDAAAEATSTINSTNIKNVNLFIRHDRDRDYTWHIDPTDQNQ